MTYGRGEDKAGDELAVEKTALRRQLRRVRLALAAGEAQQRSAAICRQLVALPEFQRAATIVGYMPFRNEADPTAALAQAAAAGKQVGLVRVEDAQHLSARRYRSGDALEPSRFGMHEPAPAAARIAEADVDLILVPALALDPRGHRLGYGGGYYDRYLPRLPRAHRVAVVYDFQVLDALPHSERDQPVRIVVTELRVLRVGA